MHSLDRKLLRDLWRTKGLVLAIALVVATAVATFIMSLGALQSLEETRLAYYERYRFADVFAGLKRAPESLERRIELAGQCVELGQDVLREVGFASLRAEVPEDVATELDAAVGGPPAAAPLDPRRVAAAPAADGATQGTAVSVLTLISPPLGKMPEGAAGSSSPPGKVLAASMAEPLTMVIREIASEAPASAAPLASPSTKVPAPSPEVVMLSATTRVTR